MTCAQIQDRLWEYCFELLEPGESQRVAEHLRRCPGCTRQLGRLRELLASWQEVSAPTGLAERALEAAEESREPVVVGEVEPVGWHVVTRWLVAAGVVAAVVLSGVYARLAGLRPDAQDTMVIAPRRFALPGPMASVQGRGAVRVLVTDGATGVAVARAQGTLDLLARSPFHFCSFETDRAGSAPTDFPLYGLLFQPDIDSTDRYELGVKVWSELGSDEFTLPIVVGPAYRPLLETDQDFYRPGETVRVRGVLLDEIMLRPQPDLRATVALLDRDGGPLLSQETTASHWGLFAAELPLPADLAPGEYRLAVSAAESVSERPLQVMEGLEPSSSGGDVTLHLQARRRWYRPGEVVQVNLRARDAQDEPVAGEIELCATIARQPAGPTVTAETDARGRGTVSLALPEVLPPADEGREAAVLRLEARLRKDDKVAGVAETFVAVSRAPVRVAVRPEAGALVPGVENLLYVLVTRPDGAPVSAEVTVDVEEGSHLVSRTDEVGLVALAVTPSDEGLKGTLTVRDDTGYQRRLALDLPLPSPAPRVLVRVERWYVPGDEPVRATVLGPKDAREVFLDVAFNGQLALTRTVPLTEGVGHLKFSLPDHPAEVVGVLELRAYVPGDTGPAGSVARQVCVGPSRPVALRAEVHGQGEERRLTLSVAGGEEDRGPALLSVAVSALPPGLERGPAHWTSRHFLGDHAPDDAVRAWLEKYALASLLSQTGAGPGTAQSDRLALAFLGAGRQLLPEQSLAAAGPVGPQVSAQALQVKRTYPGKVASVARTQARWIPPVGVGLWVLACGLGLAGLTAVVQGVWRMGSSPLAGPLAQTAVAWATTVALVFVVLPLADSPQTYLLSARQAEEDASPEVLLPAPPPALLAGEGPIHLPPVRLAGQRPRTLAWEPGVQTDQRGVVELDLPGAPTEGRLRVSVLVVTGGSVSGTTFVLRADTSSQTVALLTHPALN